ncbi:MAG: serine/threonine protein kinase [Nitrososphaeraceae archaeon]|nr:serine/threonine protein kinase [Nitrososphaeraceae archaeon]
MKQQVNAFLLKSTKKCFILILLAPLLLSNFLPNTFQLILAQPNSVENLKEYENSVFGLSIDYPSTWIIDEFEKRIKNDETVGMNNIVLFCPTPATLKSTLSNQMNTNTTTTTLCENAEKSFDIYVHNLPAGMTLEEFTNSKISSYKLELTDFKIIESNPSVTIDNNPAYKLTYTYADKINDKKIQVMEIWTVINDDEDSDDLKDHVGKAYSLRYEAIPIEFPIYLNTANNTISSFEFQNIDNDESDN